MAKSKKRLAEERDRNRVAVAERRAMLVKAKKCIWCASPLSDEGVVAHRTRCDQCIKKDRERRTELREERLRLGLCNCGSKLPDKSRRTCDVCSTSVAARQAKMAREGICPKCRRTNMSDYLLCDMCREVNRKACKNWQESQTS